MKPRLIAMGTSRKVYDLGDGTIVKVAHYEWGRCGISANLDEITTYEDYINNIPEEDRIIQLAEIVDYHKSGYWIKFKKYNNENTSDVSKKFEEIVDYIQPIDYNSCNLGKDEQGNYILLDYERIHWTWFSKKENPYYVDLNNPNEILMKALNRYCEKYPDNICDVIMKIKKGLLKVKIDVFGMTVTEA